MAKWRKSPTLCAAAAGMVLLLVSQAPTDALRQAVPVALDESVVDSSIKRMHGDARLLLAHTIMAQGARRDLAKVAGGQASRCGSSAAVSSRTRACMQMHNAFSLGPLSAAGCPKCWTQHLAHLPRSKTRTWSSGLRLSQRMTLIGTNCSRGLAWLCSASVHARASCGACTNASAQA